MAREHAVTRPLSVVALTALAVLGVERLLPAPTEVDARPMLDASVSIRTASHVSVDQLGDTVWAETRGSGFLVDSETCEVWTNHHVIENAAIVELFPRGRTSGAGIPATVVNATPRGDLAILRMQHCERIPVALPVNSARAIVESLRDGAPRWGDAGLDGLIGALQPEEAAIFGVTEGRGAIIMTRAPAGGPAAGVLREHDVIHRVGGVAVAAVDDALRIISEHRPGSVLTLDLVRAGTSMSVAITLANGWVREEAPAPDPYPGHLGMTVEMWSGRDGEEGRFTTPVITRVQGLGPAHRALIASSQRAYAVSGPFLTEYRLDVKTVTGVVLDGTYHDVETPQALYRLAEQAFLDGKALLIEVQHWIRENPLNPASDLTHARTAFYRITPRPAVIPLLVAELAG